jgi:hypothetical protein
MSSVAPLPGRRAGSALRSACLLVAVGSASAACTTSNVVTFAPLNTSRPVSLTNSYVGTTGEIVEADGYERVNSFQFTRKVYGPRHRRTRTELDLTPEFEAELQRQGADAIVNAEIRGTDFKQGSHGVSVALKWAGWTYASVGSLSLIWGLTESKGSMVRDVAVPTGGAFLSMGVLSLAIAELARKPSVWEIRVRGDLVRRTQQPSPVPVSPPVPRPVPASSAIGTGTTPPPPSPEPSNAPPAALPRAVH